jgi:hypothetical protein
MKKCGRQGVVERMDEQSSKFCSLQARGVARPTLGLKGPPESLGHILENDNFTGKICT